MNTPLPPKPLAARWQERWQRFLVRAVPAYHAYASWLVSITWKRFIVLSVLLLIGTSILESLPPFSLKVTETIEDSSNTPKPPRTPPKIKIDKPHAPASGGSDGIDISVDEHGIRITPRDKAAAPPASSASAASAPSGSIEIKLPAGVDKNAVREALAEAERTIREAIDDQHAAAADAAAAKADAEAAKAEAEADKDLVVIGTTPGGKVLRTRNVHWGAFLTDLALLWIVASIIIKISYKGRMQAEVKAAQATETAEAESLRRQVVEARMATMQAQVEPHFLFNTLASIDHLIETDPPRASQMQKNLIALLRASMPTMREASDGAPRDLGRELAVIRPYLEILKVRMEERLTAAIEVPEGLLSAQFPSMMLQTLVENAIKHGLEPKAEGGLLRVRAEVVHGKLAVSVADTGLGFGQAATAGTGVGLANIRERLQLLYGNRATLTVAAFQPTGTLVTITVPYKTIDEVAT